MEARDVVIIVLLVGLLGFAVAYFVVGPGRRRGPKPAGDIPLALRPYHSDEELESSGLTRAMSWGVALILFMAFFLPVYWLLEPQRIEGKEEFFYEQDVANGRLLYADACAECHGSAGGGGFASHPDPEVDAPWPAPPMDDLVARYEDDPRVQDLERFITDTIMRGRPGTPMPAWSTGFGGGFNDHQIESIVRYILAIQVDEQPEEQDFEGASGAEIFDVNCVRCHGENGTGALAPDLTAAFERYGGDPDAIRSIIHNGILVPDGTPMPAWEGVLTDDAIDRLMEHLEEIQEDGAERVSGAYHIEDED
jgi:cbb3-type cytochrome c oxidase subunit III